MKTSTARSLPATCIHIALSTRVRSATFGSVLLGTCIFAGLSVHSQDAGYQPPKVQFSTGVELPKLQAPPPETVPQMTLGRWDDQYLEYHNDHLERLYDPDRTQEDFAHDMLRSGQRAVTDWAKDLDAVREARRRIEDAVNDVFGTVKNWFRLDITPPREEEPYGSTYGDKLRDYKLKLNISTHPSIEVRAFHSARIRLYHDQIRAAYKIHLTDGTYARLGVTFPFESDRTIEPFLRIQREWKHGELGVGVRARRHDEQNETDIYGGLFLAMRI